MTIYNNKHNSATLHFSPSLQKGAPRKDGEKCGVAAESAGRPGGLAVPLPGLRAPGSQDWARGPRLMEPRLPAPLREPVCTLRSGAAVSLRTSRRRRLQLCPLPRRQEAQPFHAVKADAF